MIKEVLLDSEKERIVKFLETFSLKYEDDITKTFYAEEDGEITSTVSLSNDLIKCFAVKEESQSTGVSGEIITYAISYLNSIGINSYHVYTKPKYEKVFTSFGFKKIEETDKVMLLEGGISSIDDKLLDLKKTIENTIGKISDESDIAAVVANANPITNGHIALIEKASQEHDVVLLFILEEERSVFTFKERIGMAYLATRRLPNVIVLPSTQYLVSYLTFPGYFLKDNDEKSIEYARIDALIFKDYFMKRLYIKKRYIGSESKDYMVTYNEILHDVLGDSVVEIERIKEDKEVVSASTVRKLLEEKKFSEAEKYIPRESLLIFRMSGADKYGR